MYICLDLETTGLNAKTDHVIEVAITLFDEEKIIEEWSSLVRPPVSLPAFTKHLTGITDEMLKDQPTLEDLMPLIREKMGDAPIMGHFIPFDVGFLNEKGAGLSNTLLDTCQLAQALLHKEASYSLEVLTKKLAIPQPDAHRAPNDVRANIELFWRFKKHVLSLTHKERNAVLPLLQKSTWPWARFILPWFEKDEAALDARILTQSGGNDRPSETHANLSAITQILQAPFLVQESSHTDLDLLHYALSLNAKTYLVLPSVEDLSAHPQVGILKHPNQYLDEARLENYLNKAQLNDTETLLGMKLTLWLFETETGEKSDLRMIKEEANAWYDLCAQENGTPSSFFKKAQEEALEKPIALISQLHFLKDRSSKNPALPLRPQLVMGHVEDLMETVEEAWHIRLSEQRFLNDLRRLKQENPDYTEVIDALAGRVSILFGCLGMVLQKNGVSGDARHPLIIEDWHWNTQEWTTVKNAAESIEGDAAALGNQCKATPTLDEFSRYLTYLTRILQTPQPILWMTLSMDQQPIVHAFPENPAELFQERVWKTAGELHLFGHRADLKDDFAFIKKELGLPEALQTHRAEEIIGLPLDFPNRPLSSPNDPKNISESVHEITQRIPTIQGNIFIWANSMAVMEQFFYKLAPFCKENDRKLFVQHMSGGLGKIGSMAQETNGTNVFVGNENLFSSLLEDGHFLSYLVLHRLPFSNPKDPIQMSRSKSYKNTYKEFTLPQTSLRFHSILGRFLNNDWKDKRVLVLDPRIHDYEEWFL